ncbi:MAG: DNA polymerase III subunit delta [Anaerolineales bacterium]
MGKIPPVIYILHGDDELGIARFISTLQGKMGDPSMAEMNTSRLDGRRFSFGDLENAASAIPFLATRRLVILDRALNQIKSKADREKFISLLERLPQSTALVIVENTTLTLRNWLLKWARTANGRALVRVYKLPKGPAMARWIRKQAQARGGEFTHQAANLLSNIVSDDNRTASLEIDKLLAFVNYQRPVDVDDVEFLTPTAPQGNVFQMVDAIGNRNGRQALQMLHQLLSEREPLSLYGMIVRQFRLLLLTKEMQAASTTQAEIARELNVRDFVVRKLTTQTRNFSLPTLENIYRRLVEIDEEIKTGKADAEIALDTLIAGLTG